MTDNFIFVLVKHEPENLDIDVFATASAIVETLPDDNAEEINDAALAAVASPGRMFDFPLPDTSILCVSLTEPESRLRKVMERTDDLDMNEIMQQVVVTILDREEDDVIDIDHLVAYLETEGADRLYLDFIAPAIDECEEALRNFSPPVPIEDMDPIEIKERAQAVISEDRVDTERLRELVKEFDPA